MLRHTGPGKVETFPISATDTTTAVAGLLFNFDFDGDTPKPKHEEWLRDNVVPLLPLPGVKVILRGEASRAGRDAYNLALSQRRVDKVIAFLRRHGMGASQFVRQAAGEGDARLAGQADNTDDERFRSVAI